MPQINTVTEVGNITRDPELKETKNGASFAEFGLAVNRRWPSKETKGEWEEKVSFFDITVWGEQHATNIAASLAKGTRVIVVGRLEQDRWENDEGEKRNKVRIVADIVAPSLEWASAEVTKNPKANGGGDAPEPSEDF